MSYRKLNQLNKYILTYKDHIPSLQTNNVVYNISCTDCDAVYIGQTKKQLNTRVKEHKNYVKNNNQNSVLADLYYKEGHFDWNDVIILDKESNYHKRLTSEMLHIKLHYNIFNVMKDIDLLDKSYIPILNKIQRM